MNLSQLSCLNGSTVFKRVIIFDFKDDLVDILNTGLHEILDVCTFLEDFTIYLSSGSRFTTVSSTKDGGLTTLSQNFRLLNLIYLLLFTGLEVIPTFSVSSLTVMIRCM